MTTTLYRAYDKDGGLLYVGIADDWLSRWRTHRKQSEWFPEVRTVKVEEFPTRDLALVAERDAIKADKPKWNVHHNNDRPAKVKQPTGLRCDTCGGQIGKGDGWVTIDDCDVAQAQRCRSRCHVTGTDQDDYLWHIAIKDAGGLAQWHAYHRDCDPNPERSAYWFHAHRIDEDWAGHLMRKRWFWATDWWDFLDRQGM